MCSIVNTSLEHFSLSVECVECFECTGTLYFPKGADWADVFTGKVTKGGQTVTVAAPLDTIPVYTRQ